MKYWSFRVVFLGEAAGPVLGGRRLRTCGKSGVDAILAKQQANGGWRQREGLTADAYGTGESLYALGEAGGASPASPAYRKGIQFFLSMQRPDGSWFVSSRSARIQAYFDGGFPYEHNQWISNWATSWAALGMEKAIEPPVAMAGKQN